MYLKLVKKLSDIKAGTIAPHEVAFSLQETQYLQNNPAILPQIGRLDLLYEAFDMSADQQLGHTPAEDNERIGALKEIVNSWVNVNPDSQENRHHPDLYKIYEVVKTMSRDALDYSIFKELFDVTKEAFIAAHNIEDPSKTYNEASLLREQFASMPPEIFVPLTQTMSAEDIYDLLKTEHLKPSVDQPFNSAMAKNFATNSGAGVMTALFEKLDNEQINSLFYDYVQIRGSQYYSSDYVDELINALPVSALSISLSDTKDRLGFPDREIFRWAAEAGRRDIVKAFFEYCDNDKQRIALMKYGSNPGSALSDIMDPNNKDLIDYVLDTLPAEMLATLPDFQNGSALEAAYRYFPDDVFPRLKTMWLEHRDTSKDYDNGLPFVCEAMVLCADYPEIFEELETTPGNFGINGYVDQVLKEILHNGIRLDMLSDIAADHPDVWNWVIDHAYDLHQSYSHNDIMTLMPEDKQQELLLTLAPNNDPYLFSLNHNKTYEYAPLLADYSDTQLQNLKDKLSEDDLPRFKKMETEIARIRFWKALPEASTFDKQELLDKCPDDFNIKTFEILKPVIHALARLEFPQNNDTNDLAIEQTLKLTSLFGNAKKVEAYLNKFGKRDVSQAVHDACLFDLPASGKWNQDIWAQFVMRDGMGEKALRLIALAPQIEEAFFKDNPGKLSKQLQKFKNLGSIEFQVEELVSYMKSDSLSSEDRQHIETAISSLFGEKLERSFSLNSPRKAGTVLVEIINQNYSSQPDKLNAFLEALVDQMGNDYPLQSYIPRSGTDVLYQYAREFGYSRSNENTELADYCLQNGVSEPDFNRTLDYLNQGKLQDNTPNLYINGDDIGFAGFEMKKIDASHPWNLWIGKEVNCCNYLGGATEENAIAQATSSDVALYAIIRKDDGKAMAKVTGWMSEQGSLVFNSWERLGNAQDKFCEPFLLAAGVQMMNKNEELPSVILGRNRAGAPFRPLDADDMHKPKTPDLSWYDAQGAQYEVVSRAKLKLAEVKLKALVEKHKNVGSVVSREDREDREEQSWVQRGQVYSPVRSNMSVA